MVEKELLYEREKKREQEMPELTEDLFEEYFLSGNRLQYEDVYFDRRSFLTVFGILPEEDKRDWQKLNQIMLEICKEKTWALPPHVDRTREGWENTLDLFASETALALAEIIICKKEILPERTIEIVRQQVMQRVIEPFIHAKANEIWWERAHMNWCAVCNSCIGVAGIYLLEEGAQKERFIHRIIDNLTEYLQAFPSDGACLEGLDYYYYAMGHLMAFWEILEKQTNIQTHWENIKHIEEIFLFPQKCILRGGYTVSFSDSSQRGMLRLGVQGMMHERNEKTFVPREGYADFYVDPCYRYGLVSRDYLFEKKLFRVTVPETSDEEQEKYFFEKAQWFILNNRNQSLVVKGGNNAEPHNHNDVGSLIWIANEDIVLADLGAGEYTRKYFDDNSRYDYFCCRSAGHNLPIIDGKEQLYGENYCAEDFFEIENGVRMELKSAYPKECGIKNYQRKIFVADGELIMEEDFCLDHSFVMEENFVSQLKCQIREDKILLYGRERMYEMELLPQKESQIEIKPYVKQEVFNNHKGKQEFVNRFGFSIESFGEHLAVKIRLVGRRYRI